VDSTLADFRAFVFCGVPDRLPSPARTPAGPCRWVRDDEPLFADYDKSDGIPHHTHVDHIQRSYLKILLSAQCGDLINANGIIRFEPFM